MKSGDTELLDGSVIDGQPDGEDCDGCRRVREPNAVEKALLRRFTSESPTVVSPVVTAIYNATISTHTSVRSRYAMCTLYACRCSMLQ